MTIANAYTLIHKLTLEKLQDEFDFAFDLEKQKQFKELQSQYSWDIVVDYECRRRVTQYGRYKEELHSVIVFLRIFANSTELPPRSQITPSAYGKPNKIP